MMTGIAEANEVWPIVQGFSKEGVRHAKDDVGQGNRIGAGNIFEI